MEPFTIRCETCRAKLRVRDERVLGQIHECPRCGGMVQIARPAAATAAAAALSSNSSAASIAFPAPPPSVAEQVATAACEVPAAPPIAIAPASADWSRVVFWSAGGAALFIAGSLVGAVLLRGGAEEVASAPETAPVVEVVQRSEDDKRPAATEAVEIPAPPTVTEVAPIVEAVVVPVEEMAQPVSAPPPAPPVVAVEEPAPARTLVLEPVAPVVTMGELAEQLATPSYATDVLRDESDGEAKPQAATGLGLKTNVRDQLAMPVAAMEINGMPLASFVEMVSEMAAVPIALDTAVLRSAGVTPKTKVSVRAEDETIESLLTKALAAHQLAWEERDGQLVIVPAK